MSRFLSKFIHFLTHLAADVGIPIPGCRTIERIEENAHGAEVELSAEAIKEIRELVDKAEVAGGRYGAQFAVEGNSLPLDQWKAENSSCGWRFPLWTTANKTK